MEPATQGAILGVDIIQSYSERIFRTAVADGMPGVLASMMVGQSKYETNRYQNKHCRLCNAFFSYMYAPESKWQLAGGGTIADNGAPVAKYINLENSVHEMTAWIGRRQLKPRSAFKTEDEYQYHLRHGLHLFFPWDLTTISTSEIYAHLLYKCGFFAGWAKLTPEQNIDAYANGIELYKESFS